MYHPKFTYIVHQLLTIIYLFGFYVELAEPVLLRAEYQRLLDALGTFVEEVIIDITEKILFIQHGLYFFFGGGDGVVTPLKSTFSTYIIQVTTFIDN